jgi:hypothetical protein
VIVAPVIHQTLYRHLNGIESIDLPGAVKTSYEVIAEGAIVLVSVVTKFDVIVVLW